MKILALCGFFLGAFLYFQLPGNGKAVGLIIMVICAFMGISNPENDSGGSNSATRTTKATRARSKKEAKARKAAEQEEEKLFAAMDEEFSGKDGS